MDKYKILIVEDDTDTANMLRFYFEAQNYEVLTAEWGHDALEICQRTLPDLIILDIRLPDINGYEVCRQLRESHRTSFTPIIFLTEKREREDKITGLKLGAVDYITKPFDIQELRLRVRNALRRAKHKSLVSPTTGLPGSKLLKEQVDLLLGEQNWALVSISLEGLELFKEVYGFVVSNDLVRATAMIISGVTHEVDSDNLVYHADDGDFIIITIPDKVEELTSKILLRLQRAIRYFYPIKDREAGHVSLKSTTGERKAPLMSIAVGVITDESASFHDSHQVLEAVAQARQMVA